jgi:endonuclease YncB( thermonuclease family)
MYKYTAYVLRVIDADTIEVMVDLGFKIFHQVILRILGYDAPEIRGTKNPEEKMHGNRIKSVAEQLFLHQKITIETKSRDKYGRYLGNVYLNGKSFVELMENR